MQYRCASDPNYSSLGSLKRRWLQKSWCTHKRQQIMKCVALLQHALNVCRFISLFTRLLRNCDRNELRILWDSCSFTLTTVQSNCLFIGVYRAAPTPMLQVSGRPLSDHWAWLRRILMEHLSYLPEPKSSFETGRQNQTWGNHLCINIHSYLTFLFAKTDTVEAFNLLNLFFGYAHLIILCNAIRQRTGMEGGTRCL